MWASSEPGSALSLLAYGAFDMPLPLSQLFVMFRFGITHHHHPALPSSRFLLHRLFQNIPNVELSIYEKIASVERILEQVSAKPLSILSILLLISINIDILAAKSRSRPTFGMRWPLSLRTNEAGNGCRLPSSLPFQRFRKPLPSTTGSTHEPAYEYRKLSTTRIAQTIFFPLAHPSMAMCARERVRRASAFVSSYRDRT